MKSLVADIVVKRIIDLEATYIINSNVTKILEQDNDEKPSVKKEFDREETKKVKIFKPISLKMAHDCSVSENDAFELDGETYSEVIMVGRVISREEHPTRTTFDLNDNSGTIRVTFYNRSENNPSKCLQEFEYEPDCYVKVFGTLRCFKEMKAAIGVTISKITDYDELTNHWLQVFIAESVRKHGILDSPEISGGDSAKTLTKEEARDLIKKTLDTFKQTKNQWRKAEIYAELKNKMFFPVPPSAPL